MISAKVCLKIVLCLLKLIPSKVRTVRVEKRINEIVNRLNKTKVERKPDLKAEREAVNAAERAERSQQLREKNDTRSCKGLKRRDKLRYEATRVSWSLKR
ncbi:coiled-coil domain-containing protein 25-like [Hibiscus syriacus]|uniref:coiled-coil domain-containing protein 25-like n=1 Tax=Hibiscus syriacus TaxID=106335 RepID=UPI001923C792|nr:coiled-coil domain-containing protein 25-like [Hibiscus syriacus]XP_039025888.1 coiled-coil domain-containing protein 25-like [Hibiscus syriacus]